MQYLGNPTGRGGFWKGKCKACGVAVTITPALVSILLCDHSMKNYDLRPFTQKELKRFYKRSAAVLTANPKLNSITTLFLNPVTKPARQ
jgi:hypothetical protein